MSIFHTITNVQSGSPLTLLRPIDNSDGRLRIGLRQLAVTAGWHNVHKGESFSWRSAAGAGKSSVIPPGLWSFYNLQQRVQRDDIKLEVNRANGVITLTVPEGLEFKMSDGLLELLGLDDGKGGDWLSSGTYLGDKAVNFTPMKTLMVHLDELSTSENYEDGRPTTLLAAIEVGPQAFGEAAIYKHALPQYKRLEACVLGELKLTIRDHTGALLDNHGQPIAAELEVI